jgi:hypothetical protein
VVQRELNIGDLVLKKDIALRTSISSQLHGKDNLS